MGAGVVQGPEKGEGKHLVTPLFLTKLVEVRRQQGWTATGSHFTLELTALIFFNVLIREKMCQKSENLKLELLLEMV